MCKICFKCESEMTSEEGVYVCNRCLDEVMQIKRNMMEEATWHDQQQEGGVGRESVLYKLQEGKICSSI